MGMVRQNYRAGLPADISVSAPSSARPQTLQSVEMGTRLFQAGEPRRVYRVEQGAICHYVLSVDGSHDIIALAFAGDYLGLGALANHVSTAQAMVDSVVSLVDEDELDQRIAADDLLALKVASASDIEFDYVRDRALAARTLDPERQVARYLTAVLAISQSASTAEPLITDDMTSGFVAGLLGVSIDTLAQALVRLSSQGLISATPEGLRVLDVAGLERLAA